MPLRFRHPAALGAAFVLALTLAASMLSAAITGPSVDSAVARVFLRRAGDEL